MAWSSLSNELLRLRQSLSSERDLRPLGPSDLKLRPVLFDVVHRYTNGRCMDFAVAVADHVPSLKLAGFFVGESLSHAFLVPEEDTDRGRIKPDARCVEVSGIWSLREMRHFHKYDGKIVPRLLDLETIQGEMETNTANGADFDQSEVVLTVAGCLPHLMSLVSAEYRADDLEAVLSTLRQLKENGYAPAPTQRPGSVPTP